MHTNETPNYHLPQFVGTDIINPLVDTNGAYSAIDTALKDISDNEVTDAGKILALETAVGDNTAGLVKDVADLQTQNGNSVLTTDAQTLSAAINEVDAHTDTNTGNIADNALAITGLQNTVGNANNGLVKDVSDLQTKIKAITPIFTVYADGVKTRGELYLEAIAGLKALNLTVEQISKLKWVHPSSTGNSGTVMDVTEYGLSDADYHVTFGCTKCNIDATNYTIQHNTIRLTYNDADKTRWASSDVIIPLADPTNPTTSVSLGNNSTVSSAPECWYFGY